MGLRWGLWALLLCATLLGQETGPLYLHCAVELDGLTPAQSRSRNAFWKASEPPEEDQRSNQRKMNAWHKALLKKTEALLTALGVKYEAFDLEDGTPALRVLPRKSGSELNRFVAEMQAWLGTEFVYAPIKLLKENGKFSRARYNRSHNRILLCHEFVDGISEDESLHHEILHAVFHWFRLHEIDSLFHGELKAADSDDDLWEGEHYQQRMSLEELATFPLNLRLFARGLEKFAARNDLTGEGFGALLDEVERKAEIYAELTGQTTELLEEVIARSDKGKVKITHDKVKLAPMKQIRVTVPRVTFEVRHYLLRIPLIGSAEASDDDAVLARLVRLNDVTDELYGLNGKILRAVKLVKAKYERGQLDRAALEKLIAALKAPRELTLPYLTSSNGRPSRDSEAKKLPRPEGE